MSIPIPKATSTSGSMPKPMPHRTSRDVVARPLTAAYVVAPKMAWVKISMRGQGMDDIQISSDPSSKSWQQNFGLRRLHPIASGLTITFFTFLQRVEGHNPSTSTPCESFALLFLCIEIILWDCRKTWAGLREQFAICRAGIARSMAPLHAQHKAQNERSEWDGTLRMVHDLFLMTTLLSLGFYAKAGRTR